MKGEKIAANLYMLKGETLQEAEASVASCSPDSAMLWHQKLGHMSEQGMKVLVEQKLLPSLTKVSLPLCEHCITKDKLQREEENDSTVKEKAEATQIHVEKELEQRDSFEAEPEHEEPEPENSEAPTTRQSDRVRRRPNWHSDYVIKGNFAYCLLTEDVFEGLQCAWQLGYRRILVESDNSDVVHTLQAKASNAVYSSILVHIRSILRYKWEVEFCHVSGEGNRVADALTKMFSLDSFERRIFLVPPDEVIPLLHLGHER
ncbi:hypothetical protein V6N11_080575 [Hibiscus sabdariffa]|uniref:GAG-pre-integrase domain-containing protein n=1 Tax=Hibiscus sabdariffa TaxID=183260 RepID=A0ABR2R831_9ROSI